MCCIKLKESVLSTMSPHRGLMLKGCEPLPRKRCHPKSPANYVDPTPLLDSLWTTPDSSLIWDPYTCKSYKCLIKRRKNPKSYDCKDCFHLEGREEKDGYLTIENWIVGLIVLAAKPRGGDGVQSHNRMEKGSQSGVKAGQGTESIEQLLSKAQGMPNQNHSEAEIARVLQESIRGLT
ncbi:hypothetical protein BUALT_Bualt15G0100500 [Buddleja alternifolia]|uniref:Uncharacterized protein n=1 Tax=Buddleja alternifolia TaxID=168488 RepID=A0AAV6WMA6_9LAMI|nr:hypothetical protein BUALT_Bualt15G0100500 [Buddleja alternifolia]